MFQQLVWLCLKLQHLCASVCVSVYMRVYVLVYACLCTWLCACLRVNACVHVYVSLPVSASVGVLKLSAEYIFKAVADFIIVKQNLYKQTLNYY